MDYIGWDERVPYLDEPVVDGLLALDDNTTPLLCGDRRKLG